MKRQIKKMSEVEKSIEEYKQAIDKWLQAVNIVFDNLEESVKYLGLAIEETKQILEQKYDFFDAVDKASKEEQEKDL